MLYSIKNIEDLENLNKLVSLPTQVQQIRLQNKLSKQNFHETSKNFSNHLLIELKRPLNI